MTVTFSQIQNNIEKALSTPKFKGALEIIRNNALKGKLEQCVKLKSITEIKEYKLVFIGTIGTGKTTAICHLFSLLNDNRKELMAVGAGGTTVAETIIKSTEADFSFFEIEFISKSEIYAFIDDFSDRVAGSDMAAAMPQEIERALRNILSLRIINDQKPENEIFERCNNNKLDFKEKIKNRANIDVSDYEKLEYTINDHLNEKDWIKETFTKLNVASIPGYSIPKRIIINVGNKILSEDNFLNKFLSVIDTKGLDAARDRKDIDDYVKEQNTICVFTTKFADAPDANIQYLIEKYLQNNINELQQRIIVLFLPRGDEPENIIGADGLPLDDWFEGIQYRKRHIYNTLNSNSIQFDELNIFHYDAKRSANISLNDFERSEGRLKVIKRFNEIISYRNNLSDLLEELSESVNAIVNNPISPQISSRIEIAVSKIKSYEHLIVDIDFSDQFIKEFHSQYYHWATKHAINKRHGIWEWREVNLSYMCIGLTVKIVKAKSDEHYKRLLNIIQLTKETDKKDDVFNFIASQLELTLNNVYNNFIQKTANFISDEVSNNRFNYSNELWGKLINEYGGGPGFQQRIFSHYKTNLFPIKNLLESRIELNWKSFVITPLLNFLGDDVIKPNNVIIDTTNEVKKNIITESKKQVLPEIGHSLELIIRKSIKEVSDEKGWSSLSKIGISFSQNKINYKKLGFNKLSQLICSLNFVETDTKIIGNMEHIYVRLKSQ